MSGQVEEVPAKAAIAKMRQDIGQAFHAPGFVYSAPEMLEREKRAIFMKDWLFVAREEEIPNPGDFITMRILDEPIVVTRDAQGEVNAFLNMCLHRGVEVVLGAKGNAKRFSCPYHAWTYDSAGKLIGAAHMSEIECFSSDGARMRQLKVGLCEGNVMVSFDPDPVPLAEAMGPFLDGIGFLRPGLCRMAASFTVDLPCNWKFVMENFMDFYHVGVVHAKSLGKAFRMEKDGGTIKLDKRGGTSMRYSQASATPDGKSLFGHLPWFTAEDEELGTSGMAYMVPNLSIFGGPDVIRMLSAWPTSPTSSQLMVRMLIPAEKMDDPEVEQKIKVYADYTQMVLGEDAGMIISLQRATESEFFVPGPMARLETPVHNAVNYIVNRALEYDM